MGAWAFEQFLSGVHVCGHDLWRMGQRILGNVAVCDKSLPFDELFKFGNGFLQRFEVAKLSSPVLKSIVMVGSLGVLAGEKQRIQRWR